MKKILLIIIILAIVVLAVLWQPKNINTDVTPNVPEMDPVQKAEIESKKDLIRLETPIPNGTITSPLLIKGKARGNWFFEASFPIFLTNWDGLIIAEGYATAEGEWMTTEFVPFTATISFINPPHPTDRNNGSLILKKDNPSGLPEHDDALEIPIFFGQ
ncbi:MAG: Gmad2 immunoglobulin-like domain-containing protein [Minisyncoccia bacterium]